MEGAHQRIVLIPAQFEGHRPPMMRLGFHLQSRGFEIIVAQTEFNSSAFPDQFLGFRFLTIHDGLSDSQAHTMGLISLLTKLNDVSKPLLVRMLTMLEEEKAEGGVACVIYDEFMYFGGAAAEKLNIRSVLFSPSNASTSLARYALVDLSKQGLIPSKEDDLQELLVPNLHPLRYMDLPKSVYGPLESLVQLYENMSHKRAPSTVVINTTDSLESSSLANLHRTRGVPVYAIGPLHCMVSSSSATSFTLREEDRSCIEWLHHQKPKSVIYVSFGSLAWMTESEFQEMAWGLARSEQPFLWVIRPGSVVGTEGTNVLLQRIGIRARSERSCIVEWAPQKKVLAHPAVGGFWNHCGWNSTLESITQGVPMVCRPFSGDQMVTARLLSSVWRVGILVEGELGRQGVERAVRMVMVEEEGMDMRKRASDLKKRVQASAKRGGSSYNAFQEFLEYIFPKKSRDSV